MQASEQQIALTNPKSIISMEDNDILLMSKEEFAQVLNGLCALTAITVAAMAKLIRVWSGAGREVPALGGIWRTYLPLVVSGAVLPETVAALVTAPTAVLAAVAALPIDEQRRLVIDGEPVPVYEKGPGGVPTARMVAVRNMTAKHARLVFGNRTIRNDTEQIAQLTAPALPSTSRPTIKLGNVTLDMKNKVMSITGGSARLEDVVAILKQKNVHV